MIICKYLKKTHSMTDKLKILEANYMKILIGDMNCEI